MMMFHGHTSELVIGVARAHLPVADAGFVKEKFQICASNHAHFRS